MTKSHSEEDGIITKLDVLKKEIQLKDLEIKAASVIDFAQTSINKRIHRYGIGGALLTMTKVEEEILGALGNMNVKVGGCALLCEEMWKVPAL